MIWLYRLQQRLAITRNESIAILTLSGLLLLGLAVRHVQPWEPAHDPSAYAEMETRFRAHVTRLPGANRPVSGTPALRSDSTATVHINLNTASASELQRLPGIGPALSARIAAYRSTHGPFRQVADITRVRGIGEKTLDRLASMLFVKEAQQ